MLSSSVIGLRADDWIFQDCTCCQGVAVPGQASARGKLGLHNGQDAMINHIMEGEG
jgi:hypothetical protein